MIGCHVKPLFVGVVLVLAGLSGTACAGDQPGAPNSLDYTYLRAGRVIREIDYFDDRAKGYTLEASWLVNKKVYLFGSASKLEFDTLPANERTYSVGIGYQKNRRGDISGFLQIAFHHEEVNFAPTTVEDNTDGWARISWGFRTLFGKTSAWELDGGVYYDARVDFGDRNFGAWVGVGAVWNHFGFRLVADHNGDRDSVKLSIALYF